MDSTARQPNPSLPRTLMHPGASIASLAGVTVTVGPYLYGLGDALGVVARPTGFAAQPWVLLAGCLTLAGGGLALNSRRVWDQAIITAGVVLILAALAPVLLAKPALVLAVLLLGISLVFAAWESDHPFLLRSRASIPTQRDLAGAAAIAAVTTAVAAELVLVLFFRAPAPLVEILGLAIAALFTVGWTWRARTRHPKTAFALTLTAVAALTLCANGHGAVAHLLLASAALSAIPAFPRRHMASELIGPVVHHPAGPLVASFFLLCAAGTLLLHAPAASRIEGGISSIDAVFTAVSAVCVTGLIVLDTPNDFTGFGQAVILLLIQLGALGIMSYSAAVIIALGRRLPLRDESLLATSLNIGDRSQLRAVLRRLLGFTFGCEAAGAALLAWLFYRHGDGLAQAIWRGAFTAISAFCNAGFALQSDSLIPYQDNAAILHIVGALIVLGGLSPAAALAIPRLLRNKERSAQIKLILAASLALLLANFVLIAAFEWNNSLRGMGLGERLHNAWFQSVTLRTAGFNSIAFESLRPVTLLIMMASMFIGGSPGGTAGGIKTTTAAVMLYSIFAAVRGNAEITLFGRRIPTTTVDRAAAITTLGVLSLFLTVVILLLTQAMPASFAVFEAVSALATVGLSVGGTGELDSVGKIIITAAMFAGRVGPLSMFAFLSTRDAQRSLQVPVESIDVG